MIGHGGKSGHRREAFIAALMTHGEVESAARAVGVSTATAYRWLKDPDFAAEYRKAQSKVLEKALRRLQCAAEGAVKTLERNLDAEEAKDQIAASKAILAAAMKGAELLDLNERLTKLEARLAETNHVSETAVTPATH